MEGLERELSKGDQGGAVPRGAFHRRQATADVIRSIGDGMLLHQCDAHAMIIAANSGDQLEVVLALDGGEATTIHSARRSPDASR